MRAHAHTCPHAPRAQLSYDDEALAVTDEGEWQVQASPVLKLLKERGVE